MKEDLKKSLGSGNVVIGLSRVKKEVGKFKKVCVAKNCPEISEVRKLCGLAEVEFDVLKVDSHELGVMCKKPFSVSAVGIK